MITEKHNKTKPSQISFSSKFEKKVDKIMLFLEKKLTFINQIIKSNFIKKILESSLIIDTNKSLKKNIPTITKIVWWVIIIFAWIWLLTAFSTIRAIWFFVEYLWWLFFILILLNLIYIVMSWLLWFGLIKMKKRVPFFITLIIVLDLVYMIIAMLMSSFNSIPSPWMIIFYVIFAIYIIKNKDLFNK